MADYDLKYTGAQIDVLLDAVNELKTNGFIYKGVATPSTNPGTPSERVAYLASEPGTYTNFGGIVIASGLYSLTYTNGTWTGTQMQAGSDIEVVQTTGGSTTDVMSQKAVTDELNTLSTNLQDVDGYIKGDVRTLAVGQAYALDEAVKTADGKMRRMTKEVRSLNLADAVAVGDLKSYNNNTYRALKAIIAYNNATAYVEGDYAVGRPAVVTITVDATGLVADGNINVSIGGTEHVIAVTSESTAVSIAAAIVTAVGSISGWTITDNEDGTITIKCNTAGANTLAFSFTDVDETGVVVSAATVAGATTISVYDGSSWSDADRTAMVDDESLFTQVDAAWLEANATVQNSVTEDIVVATYQQIGERYLSNWKSGIPSALRGSKVLNDTVIDIVNVDTSHGYQHQIVQCQPGDMFTYTLSASIGDPTCSFLDDNNRLLGRVVNDSTGTISNFSIKVPYGCTKCLFASTTNTNKYVKTSNNELKKVEDNVSQLNNDMYALNGKYYLEGKISVRAPGTVNFTTWNITNAENYYSYFLCYELPATMLEGDLRISDSYYFRAYALTDQKYGWKSGHYIRKTIDGQQRILSLEDIKSLATFTPQYLYVFVLNNSKSRMYSGTSYLTHLFIQRQGLVKTDIKKVACWGSSSTVGLSPYLQSALGDTYQVYNEGVGGEVTQTILARLGSVAVYNTAGFVLPASSSTTVNVSLSTNPYSAQSSSGKVNPCFVYGIECVMTNGKLKRKESGDADLTIPAYTPIVLQGAKKHYPNVDFAIFQLWGNKSIDASNCVSIVKKAAECVGTDNFIVISSHTDVNVTAENALLTEYGARYFNCRLYMSQVAMYEYGLVPTETDLEYMAQGLVPSSLMQNDRVHFNAEGNTILAEKIASLIHQLGR